MRRIFFVLISALFLSGCGLAQFNAYADEVVSGEAASAAIAGDKTTSATLDLGTLIGKLPSLKNSVLYSIETNQVKYAMSFAVLGFFKQADGENLISVDAMYVPADEIGAMATIKLFNLGKYINFPILEYINLRPGVFFAANNIGSKGSDIETDYGIVISIIDIKF